MTPDDIQAALDDHGLILRGGFHPEPDDGGVPSGTGTILLIGNAGPAMWQAFQRARPDSPQPLNDWTRAVLDSLADRFGATAFYPFDGPPYWPFMRWAKRADAIFDSPIGMAIHPDYGLWHAWRGALAFASRLSLAEPPPRSSPCDACRDRPCLSACPVDAFSTGEYDTAACAAYLRSPDGADCMAGGCLARRACPVGREYRYGPDQAALHMAAFLDGQGSLRIRDYRAGDAEYLTQLFHESVHRATIADYSAEQRQAWAPEVPDPAVWHERMSACECFVAEEAGSCVGFAELREDGHIHMFYVHADRQRGGVGGLLYRHLERAARRRGMTRLTADVSCTAKPFFLRQGFTVLRRQQVTRRGVALVNYAMAKPLSR